jgi:hypothetical protein
MGTGVEATAVSPTIAGDVKKSHELQEEKVFLSRFLFAGHRILRSKNFMAFRVDGMSMAPKGIKNRDFVLVRKFEDATRGVNGLNAGDVIVLKINDDSSPNNGGFKLREFLGTKDDNLIETKSYSEDGTARTCRPHQKDLIIGAVEYFGAQVRSI